LVYLVCLVYLVERISNQKTNKTNPTNKNNETNQKNEINNHMKVLVTGAAGFIGRHLAERLMRDGHIVRALVHASVPVRDMPAGVKVVRGDVCDAGAMKAAAAGVETVFHLAAKVHDREEGDGLDAACHTVNVEGTRNMLGAAVAGGAKRFVFFSSVKAMGEEARECRDESCVPAPLTAYGRSKLAAEQLAFEYGQRSNLHVTCLRLPLVYGVGNKGNLFRMVAAIDRGFFPPVPFLQNRRSMVHVSNVVEAAVLASGQAAARGRCYIVTDKRPYSTRELYELICRALGKRIPGWSVPTGLLAAVGCAGDLIGRARGRRVLFDSDALAKLVGSAWYSSERIAAELGYRPGVSFEDALPDMIAWYRQAAA
jgi:UDP-glucose 4-epimerase